MTTKSMSDASGATGRSIGQTNDAYRAWLWWLLALVAVSQLYFVRELVAAFALFAVVFAAIAFVVSLYMLMRVSGLSLSRLAALRRPAVIVGAVPSGHGKAA